MKSDELFQQIEATLSEARGETIHMTPDQFLSYVQAHTKAMGEDETVEHTIERARHLVGVLDLAKNFESSETVAVRMMSGPLAVMEQSAWRSHSGLGMGSRVAPRTDRPAGFQDSPGGPTMPDNTGSTMAMTTGSMSGFIDKADAIKSAIEAFLKVSVDDEPVDAGSVEEPQQNDLNKAQEPTPRLSDGDLWPANFNAPEDEVEDEISFGADRSYTS